MICLVCFYCRLVLFGVLFYMYNGGGSANRLNWPCVLNERCACIKSGRKVCFSHKGVSERVCPVLREVRSCF